MSDYREAAEKIREAKSAVAFTGAGISVESGIPTFRGKEGLWSRYDPKILDIDYFTVHPEESWRVIKEIFYDYMGESARPNEAHRFLAALEKSGILKGIITQNIDNLHQSAGSRNVIEFHGTAGRLLCMECQSAFDSREISLSQLPPLCEYCGGLLKPDFVFFGEPIPPRAYEHAIELTRQADLYLIIGTTGEIMPASQVPYLAKNAEIIEINIEPSAYTESITDIFLQDRATVAAEKLEALVFTPSKSTFG
jgi:NAD-dependent deacetylase